MQVAIKSRTFCVKNKVDSLLSYKVIKPGPVIEISKNGSVYNLLKVKGVNVLCYESDLERTVKRLLNSLADKLWAIKSRYLVY